jgi:uncharacterized membrane protein YhaH (DUF805 family)
MRPVISVLVRRKRLEDVLFSGWWWAFTALRV